MKLSFEKLDDVSEWSARTAEVRYCPLAEREFKVAEHYWPSRHLHNRFKMFVN